MRTTVRLDDRLLAEARRYAAQSGRTLTYPVHGRDSQGRPRRYAAQSGRTLTSLIDEGLRDVLARRASAKPIGPVTLPTGGSGGLQPGVSIDSFAALLDVMEGDA